MTITDDRSRILHPHRPSTIDHQPSTIPILSAFICVHLRFQNPEFLAALGGGSGDEGEGPAGGSGSGGGGGGGGGAGVDAVELPGRSAGGREGAGAGGRPG